jgi:hypothetical protein
MKFLSITLSTSLFVASLASASAHACPIVWLTEASKGDALLAPLLEKGYEVIRSNQTTVDRESKPHDWIVGVGELKQFNYLGLRYCSYLVDIQEVDVPGKRAHSVKYKTGRKTGTVFSSYEKICAKAASRAALEIPRCRF